MESQASSDKLTIADLRERVESETAMRLFYQHEAAAGSRESWDCCGTPVQNFWLRIARQYVAETA